MDNVLGKLAEKIGVVVQGGTVNIGELRVDGNQQQTRSRNEQFLMNQVNAEVENRLFQSLHNQVLINLGKEFQPTLVSRFWDKENKIGRTKGGLLPENTTIINIFERSDVNGKLLILGAPGSGKTTTLIELAKELLYQATTAPERPIPVILSITTWKNDKQLILDWLLTELKLKYGTPSNTVRHFIAQNRLIFLFDGLDELDYSRQELFIKRLNLFINEDFQPQNIVVSSRQREYESHNIRLNLNGAIVCEALSIQQLNNYFSSINKHDLLGSIGDNINLVNILKTPLFLNIFIATYQRNSSKKTKHLRTTEDYKKYLINSFIEQAFSNISAQFKAIALPGKDKKYIQWLSWLSRLLEENAQRDFNIDELQPHIFKSKNSLLFFNFLTNSIIGLISFLSCLIASWLTPIETHILLWISLVVSFFAYGISIVSNSKTATYSRILRSQIFIYSLFYLIPGLIAVILNLTKELPTSGYFLELLNFLFWILIVSILGGLNLNNEIEMLEVTGLNFRRGFKELYISYLGGITISLYLLLSVIFRSLISTVDSLILLLFLVTTTFLGSTSLFLFGYGVIGRFFVPVQRLAARPKQGILNSIKSSKTAFVFFGLLASLIVICLFVPPMSSVIFCPPISIDEGSSIAVINRLLLYDLLDFSLDHACNQDTLIFLSRFFWIIPIVTFSIVGSFFGLIYGGIACLQHLVLRILLTLDSQIPWNFPEFLEVSNKYLLLQRIGGNYRFMHKLLQDHFAELP